MARAWEAYKVRWAKEEDAMMRLMEKKVVSKINDLLLLHWLSDIVTITR